MTKVCITVTQNLKPIYMGDNSYFNKMILLIVLSIACFLGLKYLLPDRLFPETLANDPNMLIDSVLLDLLDDTTLNLGQSSQNLNNGESIASGSKLGDSDKLASASLQTFHFANLSKKLEERKPYLFLPDPESKIVVDKPIIDTLLDPAIAVQGYGYLQRFYSKLKKLKEGGHENVRVAYFGDSMNDGDLIVQDFRVLLQDNYGGYGVGYVPITSMSSGSRGSVYHKHSDAWTTQSFVSTKNPIVPFGIDGQVFLARDAGNYWVSYTAGNMKHSPMLYSPTLYYGYSDSSQGYVNVTADKGAVVKKSLVPNQTVNRLTLAPNAKSLQLNFGSIQNIPIYGVDFSSSTGVHVDNFSVRGNSGLTLVKFNTNLISTFDQILDYDLIVLHYGTNVLNYGSHDYTFYEKGMTAVINKLRACFPNADILVISTADKASKINMKMVTDPAVLALTKSQKNFARDTGVGFIDLYSLMGGNGSMVDWVNKQLANKDYTHFNIKGSKQIGNLLFEELQKGFSKYNEQLAKEIKRSEREN